MAEDEKTAESLRSPGTWLDDQDMAGAHSLRTLILLGPCCTAAAAAAEGGDGQDTEEGYYMQSQSWTTFLD